MNSKLQGCEQIHTIARANIHHEPLLGFWAKMCRTLSCQWTWILGNGSRAVQPFEIVVVFSPFLSARRCEGTLYKLRRTLFEVGVLSGFVVSFCKSWHPFSLIYENRKRNVLSAGSFFSTPDFVLEGSSVVEVRDPDRITNLNVIQFYNAHFGHSMTNVLCLSFLSVLLIHRLQCTLRNLCFSEWNYFSSWFHYFERNSCKTGFPQEGRIAVLSPLLN